MTREIFVAGPHYRPATLELREMLLDARARTLALVSDLSDELLEVPRLPILNPFPWELGHIGWFQERWLLRRDMADPSLYPGADRLWDSTSVAHDSRWELSLPDRPSTIDYVQAVLDRCLQRLGEHAPDDAEAWFWSLAVFHEDMHGEALLAARQALGYPPPSWLTGSPEVASVPPASSPGSADSEVPGCSALLGAHPHTPFVFDNEKWAHPVEVAPFRIARQCVTFGEFAAFVDEAGYEDAAHWSPEGWEWRRSEGARHPVYWRPERRGWQVRCFDRWMAIPERAAMIHVNAHEAEAFCRWAGRRLPTEAEWELAASGVDHYPYPWGDEPPSAELSNLDAIRHGTIDAAALPGGDSPFGCRQMIGNVWEWTASAFEPYPGFAPDPYREYSQPWFGTHRVLRGGCWATRARLLRNSWRNFYTPDRRDVFAGFRTCAVEAR